MKRRDFLKASALATTSLFIPSFLKAFESIGLESVRGKKLVILQLTGGFDGLSAFIPYRNDLYYNNRPTLGLKRAESLRLTDEMGLNPAMGDFHKLWEKGYVSVLNNVGYPNPDRSHFRSMDIWQTASDSKTYVNTGWVGRFLDSGKLNPWEAIEIDDSLSLAMKGELVKAVSFKDPKLFYETSRERYFQDIIKGNPLSGNPTGNLGYLYQTLISADSSAKYIYDKYSLKTNSAAYPKSKLANDLKTTASLIDSGVSTKVYYVTQGGYDTHVRQDGAMTNNLKEFSEAMYAFITDLKSKDHLKDTIVMVFSEFGRRVKQNASNGTDHGAANNLILLGEKIAQKGFINELPNLADLDENGDMRYSVDFRAVYATLLNQWLGSNDKQVLGKSFNRLNFL